MNAIDIISRMESEVRGYVRAFPTVFSTAKGVWLVDSTGRRFIDFFAGAGTLNYGHNHPLVKEALLRYVYGDGIQHSLDMATEAKIAFLETFEKRILGPRGLDYKVQFTGPTGTNSVEAAIKLARKVTRRSHVVAFTGGYHGHSLGSLALTSNRYYHDEPYGSHSHVSHLPFDGYLGNLDTSSLLDKLLADPSSGLPMPAAVILEPVQGEGGVNVASAPWLRAVAEACRRHGVLLICDEIQVGNGRTGDFFAFEKSGIRPDIICLSKSLGGGLPISLLMIRPDLDVWKPGEHTGTFRGNNLAFVAGRTLLEHYWTNDALSAQVKSHESTIRATLQTLAQRYVGAIRQVRGRGMIWGVEFTPSELATRISRQAFERGMIIETCGSDDHVLKLMPPLVASPAELSHGLSILRDVFADVIDSTSMGPVESRMPPADASPADQTAQRHDDTQRDEDAQWAPDCDMVVSDDAIFISEDEPSTDNDRIAKQSVARKMSTQGRQTRPGLPLTTPDISGPASLFPAMLGHADRPPADR